LCVYVEQEPTYLEFEIQQMNQFQVAIVEIIKEYRGMVSTDDNNNTVVSISILPLETMRK
jgi:hypothetical protein